jgi:hypothetical protein
MFVTGYCIEKPLHIPPLLKLLIHINKSMT